MSWMNDDGLYVKFGKEESALARGGEVSDSQKHELQFEINYTDVLSATAAVLGSVAVNTGDPVGTFGVVIPAGARLEAMEVVVKTAFTSSGTIGSSTLVIGTKKASDRSTALDEDALTTTSFVGSALDAAGERTYIVPGVTGAGAGFGATTTEAGVICVANSAHATHPYTAGKAICRLFYYLP